MTNYLTTLGEIVEIYDGPHATPKKTKTGPYFLSISSLDSGRLDLSKSAHLDESSFKKWTKRVTPQSGDLLFSYETRLGEAALMPADVKACLGRRMGLLRPRPGKVIPEYLLYEYLSPYFQQVIFKNTIVGATVNRISLNEMPDFPIRIPPIEEQEAISSLLMSIDKKIEINNKINAELEAMAKLIYDYWFVQFDFPDANGKPYKSSGGKMVYNQELKREIPEGWTVDIINNVVDVKDGTHDSPKPTSEGFHLITSKNLKAEGLDFVNANLISEEDYESINKRSNVDTGDILFSMIGSIGAIYKIDEEDINFAIKNVALYKTSMLSGWKNFVYMYLKSYDMQRYMGNVISGSIQKFIGLGALRNMPILKDEATIKSFAIQTEYIFKKLTLLKVENQKLTELRDWLLPMLMNGQVTVKESP